MIGKSTLIYAPAVVGPRLAAFLITIILTHGINASQFGLYVLVNLVGETADMSTSNWIRFSFLRSDISRPDAWRDSLRKSLVLMSGASIISIMACFIISCLLGRGVVVHFFIGLVCYVLSNGLLRIGLVLLQLEERRHLYSACEVARALCIFASTLFLIHRGVSDFLDFVIANALITAVVGMFSFWIGFNSLPSGLTKSAFYIDRIQYGLPIIALTLAGYAVGGTDRVLLKILGSAAGVGMYSAAYTLGRTPIDVVGNAVNQGGFPELMKRYELGGFMMAGEFLGETLDLITLLLTAILGGILSLSTVAADAILPRGYHEAAAVMPYAACAGTLIGLKSYVFDNIFHAVKRNWLQFFSFFPAVVVTVAVAYALIPAYGAVGAGCAACLGGGAGLMTSAIATRHFIVPNLKIISLCKSLLAATLAAGATGFLMHWFPFNEPMIKFLSGALAYPFLWVTAIFL